jgi:hypothetical protein
MNIDQEITKRLRSAGHDAAVDAAIEAFATTGVNTPCYIFTSRSRCYYGGTNPLKSG